MKILLLGGTGYLGGNLAKKLMQHSLTVTAAVRENSNTVFLDKICANKAFISANQKNSLEDIFKSGSFDCVINCACVYRPDTSLYGNMLDANLIFPLEALSLSLKYDVKTFVTMGTGLPDNFSHYSFTKSKFSEMGKFFSERNGINFADMRLEMFYGGENEPETRFLKNTVTLLKQNKRVPLTQGFQKRDIIHIDDLTDIITQLVEQDIVKGYKKLPAGSGESHSIREIAAFLKEKTASSSILGFGDIESRAGEPDTLADMHPLAKLGIKPKYAYFEGLEKAYISNPNN